jgi:pimeloyl-ACP methyl ester carboxylesterase
MAATGQRDGRHVGHRMVQNAPVGSWLGTVVNSVLTRGLVAIEQAFPMPARLGAQLAPGTGARPGADPVVLVGGFDNEMSGWDEWRRSLIADGFQVFVFDPPTVGLGDMDESAAAVAAFIQDVKRRTGRAKVDVIGFSEGGLLARTAVARLGCLGSVDRLISLASPAGGVPANGIYDVLKGFRFLLDATPKAAIQLLTGSDVLRRVEAEDRDLRMPASRDPRAPRFASLFSRTLDMVVTPWSGSVPGMLNIPVWGDRGGLGPTHFGMYHLSDRAYEAARTLLLDGSDADAVTAARARS